MSNAIYFVYGDREIHFPDHAHAVRFLEEAGYVFSGEAAFEVHEGFKGYIEFWTEAGRDLSHYSDGYEPRLYVGEDADGENS